MRLTHALALIVPLTLSCARTRTHLSSDGAAADLWRSKDQPSKSDGGVSDHRSTPESHQLVDVGSDAPPPELMDLTSELGVVMVSEHQLAAETIVFLAKEARDGAQGLYAVEAHDAGSLRQLATPPAGAVIDAFRVTRDGKWVAFTLEFSDRRELWMVASSGAAPAARAHPAYPPATYIRSFSVSPASDRVAFAANAEAATMDDLYSARFDGPTSSERISAERAPTERLMDYVFTASGTHIVYGTSVQLRAHSLVNHTTIALSTQSVHTITLSPDGHRVLYQAHRTIYSSPVTAHQPVSHFYTGSSSRQLRWVAFTPNSKTALMLTSSYELRAADGATTGNRLLTLLLPTNHAPGAQHWAFTSDSQRAVFAAEEAERRVALWVFRLDGTGAAKVTPDIPATSDIVSFALAKDDTAIFYSVVSASGERSLHRVSLLGSDAAAVQTVGSVNGITVVAGAPALFYTYAPIAGGLITEIRAVDQDGSNDRPISPPLSAGAELFGDFEVATSIRRVIYRRSTGLGGDVRLYSAAY